jgi:hypothetical protein
MMKKGIFLISCLAFLSGCSKDKSTTEVLPFQWVKPENKLTYNYYSPIDTTLGALKLTFTGFPNNSNIEFKFDFPEWSWIPGSKLVGESFNAARRSDGLHKFAASTCGFFSLGAFDYLGIPAHAVTGEYYPYYLCKDVLYTSFKVLETNKTITTSLGGFNTFVLQDTASLRKEYWDEKSGIVKFELFDSSGVFSGSYELVSKNY